MQIQQHPRSADQVSTLTAEEQRVKTFLDNRIPRTIGYTLEQTQAILKAFEDHRSGETTKRLSNSFTIQTGETGKNTLSCMSIKFEGRLDEHFLVRSFKIISPGTTMGNTLAEAIVLEGDRQPILVSPTINQSYEKKEIVFSIHTLWKRALTFPAQADMENILSLANISLVGEVQLLNTKADSWNEYRTLSNAVLEYNTRFTTIQYSLSFSPTDSAHQSILAQSHPHPTAVYSVSSHRILTHSHSDPSLYYPSAPNSFVSQQTPAIQARAIEPKKFKLHEWINIQP